MGDGHRLGARDGPHCGRRAAHVLARDRLAAGHYDTSFVETHRDALVGDGSGAMTDARAKTLAAALAVAAARAGGLSTEPRETSPPISPWVSAHRSRLLR